jgi:hypothetical protein
VNGRVSFPPADTFPAAARRHPVTAYRLRSFGLHERVAVLHFDVRMCPLIVSAAHPGRCPDDRDFCDCVKYHWDPTGFVELQERTGARAGAGPSTSGPLRSAR